jgi:hypothetical protein
MPVKLAQRDDLLLVRVDPPMQFENELLEQVVIAARHVGESVRNITQWPCYVHIGKVINDKAPIGGRLENEDVISIAWAELYKSEDAAKMALKN